MMVRFLDW